MISQYFQLVTHVLERLSGFANTVPPHGQSLIVDLTTFDVLCYLVLIYGDNLNDLITLGFLPAL